MILVVCRRLNLELEKEFGAKVWQENLAQQERTVESFKARNETLSTEIQEVNVKRKFSQVNQVDAFL